MPSSFIEPCLPSPADRPPSGANWIHEIKHDGYRLMARRDPAGIQLITWGGQTTPWPHRRGTPRAYDSRGLSGDGYRLNLKVFSLKLTEQIIAEHPACPSLQRHNLRPSVTLHGDHRRHRHDCSLIQRTHDWSVRFAVDVQRSGLRNPARFCPCHPACCE